MLNVGERSWKHGGGQPGWECPWCDMGRLVIDEGRVQKHLTADSHIKVMTEDDHEPTDLVERFSAVAICNVCLEVVTVAGEALPDTSSPDGPEARDFMVARWVSPSPRIIERGETSPEKLRQLISRAELLYWVDASSCANALRALVEAFLRDQGIAHLRTLHDRIEAYSKLDTERELLALHLMATKVLGNAGSHEDLAVKDADVLDAFEQVEFVFDRVYGRRARLTKKAQAIVAADQAKKAAAKATKAARKIAKPAS